MWMTKWVTWHHLKKGMKIYGYKQGNAKISCVAKVDSVNASSVAVLVCRKELKLISTENTFFEIGYSREEFERQYYGKAKALVAALNTELDEHEIGPHRFGNIWICYDPYEMAAVCDQRGIRILGVCRTIEPKYPGKPDPMDIGICKEEDGEISWCHASSIHLDSIKDLYKELY